MLSPQCAFDFDHNVPDITRHRHRGNAQSVQANLRADGWKPADRDGIARLILSAGPHGMTSLDLEEMLKHPKHYFSGRLTELKAAKVIFVIGTRNGCCVLVHRDCLIGGAA
jgi:hypothetical protein